VKEKLDGADVAFVGHVVSVQPVPGNTGIERFDYGFVVDHVVKGTLGDRATLRAAKLVDIDNQTVTAGADVAIGVLAGTASGRLVTSSCGLVDPGSLMGAADEPKGGPIKLVIGIGILGLVLAYSFRRLKRRREATKL
jgi:hypothetical protein